MNINMKKEKVFYTELAYLFGIIFLAFGAAMMARANFGMSVVVAPAYILHLKISTYYSFFSFGMAEYTLQAILLIILSFIMKRFKINYLFSFITALFYGCVLDTFMMLINFFPFQGLIIDICFYVIGVLFCDLGIMFIFHTYITPEAYELFMKEVSNKFGIDVNKFKLGYDICSCIISIIMSFSFFGFMHFRGVQIGTVICALCNGFIIGELSKIFEKKYKFSDRFKLREKFTI